MMTSDRRRAMLRIRRSATIAGVIVSLLVAMAPPASALTPVKVVGGRSHQYWPSSNGAFLAWTEGSNAYVRRLGTTGSRRINPSGTSGGFASFVGSTDMLVLTLWRERAPADVYFYDVITRARTRAPSIVNRPDTWEWGTLASAKYVLFMRSRYSSAGRLLDKRMLLYDRDLGSLRVLETGVSRLFAPTFAGDTYVAWTTGGTQGTIHYWSADGGEQAQPNPTDLDQFAGWIDETAGTLYFGRSRWCGRAVTLRRAQLGSAESDTLASLPRGVAVVDTISVAPNAATGHEDLFFSRYGCAADRGDIYALRGVDTVIT